MEVKVMAKRVLRYALGVKRNDPARAGWK